MKSSSQPISQVPFCVPQPNQRNDHAVPERLSIQHDDSQMIGIVEIVGIVRSD